MPRSTHPAPHSCGLVRGAVERLLAQCPRTLVHPVQVHTLALSTGKPGDRGGWPQPPGRIRRSTGEIQMTYQAGMNRFSAGRIALALLTTLALFMVFAFS